MPTAGPILLISNDTNVSISDLQVREGLGGTGDGILIQGSNSKTTLTRVIIASNAGRGINLTAGGTLTIRRSIIAANGNGGMDVRDVGFDITNTLIVRNGSPIASVGGMRIATPDITSRMLFNTIADNVTDGADSIRSGVNCDSFFVASGNIVTGNALDTSCGFEFSLFDNTTPVLPAGMGNKNGDPKFDTTDVSQPDRPTFYRIKDGSVAIDNADPAATLADDIDGEPRPKGLAPDIGADEHSL